MKTTALIIAVGGQFEGRALVAVELRGYQFPVAIQRGDAKKSGKPYIMSQMRPLTASVLPHEFPIPEILPGQSQAFFDPQWVSFESESVDPGWGDNPALRHTVKQGTLKKLGGSIVPPLKDDADLPDGFNSPPVDLPPADKIPAKGGGKR